MYDTIVRRFLSIFYPPAIYQKVSIVTKIREEQFFSNFKVLAEEGYLKVTGVPQVKKDTESEENTSDTGPVSYTHLTLPTTRHQCRSRWSPYH